MHRFAAFESVVVYSRLKHRAMQRIQMERDDG